MKFHPVKLLGKGRACSIVKAIPEWRMLGRTRAQRHDSTEQRALFAVEKKEAA